MTFDYDFQNVFKGYSIHQNVFKIWIILITYKDYTYVL